jgi:hypothetical protein
MSPFTPTFPPTERVLYGEVVPIPTFPPRKVAAGPAPSCETARVGYAEVEEAKIPARPQSAVVVAEVFTPKWLVGVKSKPPADALPVIVTGDEPRILKVEHETDPEQETVVVDTPYTPAPPFETRSCDDVGC